MATAADSLLGIHRLLSRPPSYTSHDPGRDNTGGKTPEQLHGELYLTLSPQLPFWALVSFGAFLLFKLGYGVLTFNNVPDAYDELMGQIKQAKADLRKKGVDVSA